MNQKKSRKKSWVLFGSLLTATITIHVNQITIIFGQLPQKQITQPRSSDSIDDNKRVQVHEASTNVWKQIKPDFKRAAMQVNTSLPEQKFNEEMKCFTREWGRLDKVSSVPANVQSDMLFIDTDYRHFFQAVSTDDELGVNLYKDVLEKQMIQLKEDLSN